jgi:hypothetical protein
MDSYGWHEMCQQHYKGCIGYKTSVFCSDLAAKSKKISHQKTKKVTWPRMDMLSIPDSTPYYCPMDSYGWHEMCQQHYKGCIGYKTSVFCSDLAAMSKNFYHQKTKMWHDLAWICFQYLIALHIIALWTHMDDMKCVSSIIKGVLATKHLCFAQTWQQSPKKFPTRRQTCDLT